MIMFLMAYCWKLEKFEQFLLKSLKFGASLENAQGLPVPGVTDKGILFYGQYSLLLLSQLMFVFSRSLQPKKKC